MEPPTRLVDWADPVEIVIRQKIGIFRYRLRVCGMTGGGLIFRMRVWTGLISLISLSSIAPAADEESIPDPERVRQRLGAFIKPVTEEGLESKAAPDLVDLGRRLFYEKRLSASGDFSCQSCHDLAQYGSRGEALEALREADNLPRDVPALFNIADLLYYGWDGAAQSLGEKTAASLCRADEMGKSDPAEVVARIEAIEGYGDQFAKAFPKDDKPLTFENTVAALEAFQRGLVSQSPVDAFLLGDDKALTADQLRGALLFDELGCAACHTGTGFGGQMVQKAGVVIPWPNQEDLGYFGVTKNPAHKMFFKVPSLRNVEKTAPYFHDASNRSLARAVKTMALYERGENLPISDVLLVAEFLKSLTGEIPEEYTSDPDAPAKSPENQPSKSTNSTSKRRVSKGGTTSPDPSAP